VLGINEKEQYEAAEIALEPGDILLLYTDGVTEALDFQDRAYGRERVSKSLLTHGASPDASAEFIAKQILWDVRRFVGLVPQGDDITVVAIRVV
jgi:sigma-B regulation protein RsbU (phosphoserine phosphatase)